MTEPSIQPPNGQEEDFHEGSITSTAVPAVWNAAEVSQQVSTAKAYPRSIEAFRKEAAALITWDEQTASECLYTLPRGEGTTIEGPSARFAEILAYAWGNCRIGAQVVDETAEFVIARGTFYDLQQNTALQFDLKRRITDKKGRRYSADMVAVTSTAACSIALRNAILKGIPKALWKGLFAQAKQVITGKIETLATRRQEKIALFKPFGVTPDMLYRVLGVKGISEVSLEDLTVLTGMLNSLRDGEVSVETMFADAGQIPDQKVASAAEAELTRLKRKYVRKPEAERERLKVEEIQRNRRRIMEERERLASLKVGQSAPAQTGAPSGENSSVTEEVQAAQQKLDQRRGQNPDADDEAF